MSLTKFDLKDSLIAKLSAWVLMACLIAGTFYSCQHVNRVKGQRQSEHSYKVLERIDVQGKCLEVHVKSEISGSGYEYSGRLSSILRNKDQINTRTGTMTLKSEKLPSAQDRDSLLFGSEYVPPSVVSFRYIDESDWNKDQMSLRGVTSNGDDRELQALCHLKVTGRTKYVDNQQPAE